ncbi:HAMP domain-containing sensor histidine kinase [Asaia sp. HN010]|uniref:sensor histidine kinase n=1 Tax=Asaia sp. HN010 TaxID=3081233 RepID=UPI0030177B0E
MKDRHVIRYLHPFCLLIIIVAIFVADTLTHYEVAMPVLYTVVILYAALVIRRGAIGLLTLVCLALTGVSFAFTVRGNVPSGLINLGLSTAAIVITAWLALRMLQARDIALRTQERLTRVTTAQTLSGLTTSIVHELNQPLAAVTMSSQACKRWLSLAPPDFERARNALARIEADATRAAAILTRMRALTKGGTPEAQRFSLGQAIGEVVQMIRHRLDQHGIFYRFIEMHEPVLAYADPVQIQQVTSNLLANAIEAIIDTKQSGGVIEARIWYEEGHACCRIEDSGTGIPPGLASHLFEAFWTSKEEGTGIGLAISRNLVEANKGQIWVMQDQKKGTAFCYRIPAATPPERESKGRKVRGGP